MVLDMSGSFLQKNSPIPKELIVVNINRNLVTDSKEAHLKVPLSYVFC